MGKDLSLINKKLNTFKYKKVVLIFLLSFFLIFLGIRIVNAQAGTIPETSADKSLCSWSDPSSIEIVTEGKCREKVWVGACSTLINTGQDTITGYKWRDFSCTYKNGDVAEIQKIVGSRNEGLMSMVHNASVAVLNQKPVSGIQFFEDKVYALQNVGKVDAQSAPAFYYPGTGFDLLRPIQGLWGWSVNVVYGLLILVIVGVALAIIFRANIDGGTAVTIQNAIPNIAMAMILVPLSYAISGLFIDAVTLGTNAVHQFFLAPGSPANVVYEERSQFGTGLSGYGIIDDGSLNDRGLFPDDDRINIFNAKNGVSVDDSLNNYLNTDPSFGSINQAGLILGIVQIFDPSATGWMGEIVNLVIAVILLLTSLRIFWILLTKYATILFYPIFSPFIFATVAIPGNGTKAIMTYVKTLGSFSLHYIVAYAMLLLSVILANESFQSQIPDIQTTGYVPPLLGINNQIQSFTDENSFLGVTGLMLGLGAIVIYLNIPSALKGIDKALGVEMALPSFITNAWQSAKDSVDLARRGIAAPGQALSVAGTVASAPGKGIQSISSARTKGFQSVSNTIDRLRGVRPGEEGSYLARRRARLQSELTKTQQARSKAIKDGKLRVANSLLAKEESIKRDLGSVDGASGGDGGKTEGANEITAELSWGGQKGMLVVDGAVISDLMADQALYSGQIKIVSKTPLFPDRNSKTRNFLSKTGADMPGNSITRPINNTLNKAVPGGLKPVSVVDSSLIHLFLKDKNQAPVIGANINTGEISYAAPINNPIFAILSGNNIIATVTKASDIAIDDDGKTIKFPLKFNLMVPVQDFLAAIKTGNPYKAFNEIEIGLDASVLGAGSGLIFANAPVGFIIQPQFANIPGLESNPSYTNVIP